MDQTMDAWNAVRVELCGAAGCEKNMKCLNKSGDVGHGGSTP